MKNNLLIFFGGVLKSILATCLAYFVAHNHYWLAFGLSPITAIVYTINVYNVAIANWTGRIYFAAGFTAGVGISLFVLKNIFGI